MLAAVLFDLDCTLVDRVNSIRQYAIRFAEDFRQRLVSTNREGIAEVLIAADGWGIAEQRALRRHCRESGVAGCGLHRTKSPRTGAAISRLWRSRWTVRSKCWRRSSASALPWGSSPTALSAYRHRNSTSSASAPSSGRW